MNFFTNNEKKISSEFLKKGYIIKKIEKIDDLIKIKKIFEDFIIKTFTWKIHCITIWRKTHSSFVIFCIYIFFLRINVYISKIKHFDEDGELVNTQNCSDIKNFGDRELPSKFEIIPADKEGHKTVFEILENKFNTAIKDNFFTQQNMKRVR